MSIWKVAALPDYNAKVRMLPVPGARPALANSVDLRELIPRGASVKRPIRYSDSVWNFDGYPLVNTTDFVLDFDRLPARWRNTVKDWTLLRLAPKLAENGKSGLNTTDVMAAAAAADSPLKFPSLLAYVTVLGFTLPIIERDFGDRLDSEDWQSFARTLSEENPRAQAVTLANYVRPLLSLWLYRGLLGVPGMFGGRPFGGVTPEEVFRVPQRDLNVERPAPEICGPLLGMSLWIMDHCTEDIILRLEKLAKVPDLGARPKEEQIEAVGQLLLRWETTGRPLPGVVSLRGKNLTPAWATFVKLAGCSSMVLKNPSGDAKKILDRLRQDLGVSASVDGFNLPITEVQGGDGKMRPWTDSLAPTRYGLELDYWAGMLAYCCAMVITMLTTVRERELAAIPDDCLFEATYERGDLDVPVTKMRGFLVKNRTEPVPTSWVVGDDVVRAVAIIHRLKAALGLDGKKHPQTGTDVLLHPGLGRRFAEERRNTLQLTARYLEKFAGTGTYLARRGLILPLPPLPRWLAHRTLRITALEAYASQAWGDALAAEQGKWSNRTVAEGYLGHLPRSIYIADPASLVEARQLGIGQALVEVARGIDQDPANVAGNGTARLEKVINDEHDLLTGPVSNRQLIQMAKRNRNIYVGEHTICVFGPGGMCGNNDQAEFKLCHPFACRNSATTRSQRARLELRRRGWEHFTGVFERARLKIESDLPGLVEEFAAMRDSELRSLILADLPGRAVLGTE